MINLVYVKTMDNDLGSIDEENAQAWKGHGRGMEEIEKARSQTLVST
jgi:hypothetical protein